MARLQGFVPLLPGDRFLALALAQALAPGPRATETLPWPLAPALATALALAPDLASGPWRSAEGLVRGSLFRPADLRPRAPGRAGGSSGACREIG